MDSKQLEQLLKKYWDCETSVEEENELKAWFRNNPAPEHLKDTAALFLYFGENKKKEIADVNFDHQVIEDIKPRRGRMASLVQNSMRIAAGLIVLMVATWFVRNEIRKTTPQEMVDTYDDPKLALEETKKALKLISKSFGAAEDEAKNLNLFNKAQEEIKNPQD